MASSTFGIKTRCSVTTSRRVRTAKSMTDRFRLSSTWAQRFADHQIAVTALLRHAGLPTGLFQQEKVHVTAELFALWRSVSEMSSDPAIGLKWGTEPRFERSHPSVIAAFCSRSLGDALERIARYKQLTCPEEIRIDRKAQDTSPSEWRTRNGAAATE